MKSKSIRSATLEARLTALATVLTVVIPVPDAWKPLLTVLTLFGIVATLVQIKAVSNRKWRALENRHAVLLRFTLAFLILSTAIFLWPRNTVPVAVLLNGERLNGSSSKKGGMLPQELALPTNGELVFTITNKSKAQINSIVVMMMGNGLSEATVEETSNWNRLLPIPTDDPYLKSLTKWRQVSDAPLPTGATYYLAPFVLKKDFRTQPIRIILNVNADGMVSYYAAFLTTR